MQFLQDAKAQDVARWHVLDMWFGLWHGQSAPYSWGSVVLRPLWSVFGLRPQLCCLPSLSILKPTVTMPRHIMANHTSLLPLPIFLWWWTFLSLSLFPLSITGCNAWVDHGHMAWIDACFQALLSAKILLKMHKVIQENDPERKMPQVSNKSARKQCYKFLSFVGNSWVITLFSVSFLGGGERSWRGSLTTNCSSQWYVGRRDSILSWQEVSKSVLWEWTKDFRAYEPPPERRIVN